MIQCDMCGATGSGINTMVVRVDEADNDDFDAEDVAQLELCCDCVKTLEGKIGELVASLRKPTPKRKKKP